MKFTGCGWFHRLLIRSRKGGRWVFMYSGKNSRTGVGTGGQGMIDQGDADEEWSGGEAE